VKEVGAPPFVPPTSPVLSMIDTAAVGAEGGSAGWRGSRALPSSRGKLVVPEEVLERIRATLCGVVLESGHGGTHSRRSP